MAEAAGGCGMLARGRHVRLVEPERMRHCVFSDPCSGACISDAYARSWHPSLHATQG